MIKRALAEAALNPHYPQWKLAALIVKGGSVISTGLSKRRNDPLNVPGGENCSEHAEAAALRRARKSNLSGATAYIARIGRDGEPKLAKPCSECEQALRDAGIKKIVYTTEEGIEIERFVD